MPRYDDNGSDPCDLGTVKVVAESEKAIKVTNEDDSFWVPKSVVHDDSEVWKNEDEGKLVVKQWWAEKENRV